METRRPENPVWKRVREMAPTEKKPVHEGGVSSGGTNGSSLIDIVSCVRDGGREGARL